MFEWIIGFFIYCLIGFFYILFLPTEYRIDGYIIAVSIVALFWPFVLQNSSKKDARSLAEPYELLLK